MKTHSRTLLAAALLALGTAAFAQTPAPAAAATGEQHAHRGGHHMGQGDPARMQARLQRMQERVARRMAQLKDKLKITPAQESAWTAWTAALQPTAPGAMQRPDRAEIERMTTPQRIDRMRALRAERQARMDKRADATKTFYAALNAEQQKQFDAESLRMRGGKQGRGGHGHGGRGHHG